MHQPIAVGPQHLAQRGGVPPIRHALLPVVRLDQDHLGATVVLEHPDQPVVEAANLQNCHEGFPIPQPSRLSWAK